MGLGQQGKGKQAARCNFPGPNSLRPAVKQGPERDTPAMTTANASTKKGVTSNRKQPPAPHPG